MPFGLDDGKIRKIGHAGFLDCIVPSAILSNPREKVTGGESCGFG
jgi:hypothetical protein